MSRPEWVQFDKIALQRMAQLIMHAPAAAAIMHLIVSRSDWNNTALINQADIARFLGVSRNTVNKHIKYLEKEKWIAKKRVKGSNVLKYTINRWASYSNSESKRENIAFYSFILPIDLGHGFKDFAIETTLFSGQADVDGARAAIKKMRKSTNNM